MQLFGIIPMINTTWALKISGAVLGTSPLQLESLDSSPLQRSAAQLRSLVAPNPCYEHSRRHVLNGRWCFEIRQVLYESFDGTPGPQVYS